MEYVTLGKTGLKVSKIGLGGIPIQKIDAEGTRILVHKLSDRGVNYIDTATRRGLDFFLLDILFDTKLDNHQKCNLSNLFPLNEYWF